MQGAMKLMEQGGKTALELIREAATPGGVSTEKLYTFEKHGLRGILIEAMRAAHEKVTSFHVE
jgi:pyrroline-5-carboxylate reductase